MTPQQFRACVDQLRWPQWRLAEDLGVPQLKVRKWSAGVEVVPEVVAVWIRDLAGRIEAAYALCPPPAVPRKASGRKPASAEAE